MEHSASRRPSPMNALPPGRSTGIGARSCQRYRWRQQLPWATYGGALDEILWWEAKGQGEHRSRVYGSSERLKGDKIEYERPRGDN